MSGYGASPVRRQGSTPTSAKKRPVSGVNPAQKLPGLGPNRPRSAYGALPSGQNGHASPAGRKTPNSHRAKSASRFGTSSRGGASRTASAATSSRTVPHVRFDTFSLAGGTSGVGSQAGERSIAQLKADLESALSSQETLNLGFVLRQELALAEARAKVTARIAYLRKLADQGSSIDPLVTQNTTIALKNLEIDQRRVKEMPFDAAVEELVDVVMAWDRKQSQLSNNTFDRFKTEVGRSQQRLSDEQSGALKDRLTAHKRRIQMALAEAKSAGQDAHKLAKALLSDPDAPMTGFQEYGKRVDALVTQSKELQAEGAIGTDLGKGQMKQGELARSRVEIEALQRNIGFMKSFAQDFVKGMPDLPDGLKTSELLVAAGASSSNPLNDEELLERFQLQVDELDQDVLRTRDAVVFKKKGVQGTGDTGNLAIAADVTDEKDAPEPTPVSMFPVTSVLDEQDRVAVQGLYDVDEVPLLEFLALERRYNKELLDYECYKIEYSHKQKCASCEAWSNKLVTLRSKLKDLENKIGPQLAKDLIAQNKKKSSAAKRRSAKSSSVPSTPKRSDSTEDLRAATVQKSTSRPVSGTKRPSPVPEGSAEDGTTTSPHSQSPSENGRPPRPIQVSVEVQKRDSSQSLVTGTSSMVDAAPPEQDGEEGGGAERDAREAVSPEVKAQMSALIKSLLVDGESLEVQARDMPRLLKIVFESTANMHAAARANGMTVVLRAIDHFLNEEDLMIIALSLCDRLLDATDVRVLLSSWVSTLVPALSQCLATHFAKVGILERALSALDKISTYGETFRWFRRGDTISVIASSMQSFKKELGVQYPGLTILSRLAVNPNFTSEVVDAGCISAVVAAVYNAPQDPKIAMHALNCFLALCSNTAFRDRICVEECKEGSAVSIPAVVLKYNAKDLDLQYRACILVRTLAVSPKAREQLIATGCLSPLVIILETYHDNAKLVQQALLALRALLQLPSALALSVEEEAVPAVVLAVREWRDELPIQRCCASIFNLYAQQPEFRGLLAKYGLLKELMTNLLLFSRDTVYAMKAAATTTLMLQEPENHNRVDVLSGSHALCESLGRHLSHVNVISVLMEALVATLASGIASKQDITMFDEVNPLILKVMQRYPRHAQIQAQALAVLRLIVDHGTPTRAGIEGVGTRLVQSATAFDTSEEYIISWIQLVTAITGKMPEDAAVLSHTGVLDTVISLSVTHLGHADITQQATALLVKFVSADLLTKETRILSVVDTAIKSIKRHVTNLRIQQLSFALLVGLTSSGGNASHHNCRLIAQAKGLKPILHSLSKHEDVYLHLQGLNLFCVCSTVFINDGERFVNIEGGVVETVLQSMKLFINNSEVVTFAVNALKAYLGKPGPKSAFLHFDGPGVVIASAAACKDDGDVVKAVVLLIARLCNNDKLCQTAFLDAGSLPVLVEALTTDSPIGIIIAILLSIQALSGTINGAHLRDYKLQSLDIPLVKTLVSTLATYIENADAVDAVCGVLEDLCTLPEMHPSLFQDQAVEAFLGAMVNHPDSFDIQRSGVAALSMLVYDDGACTSLTQHNATMHILKLLEVFQGKGALIGHCLVILQRLAETSILNRQVLEEPESIAMLADVMATNTSFEALVVLGKLDLTKEESQEALLAGNGLASLISGMQRHIGHLSLQVECVELIHQLATTGVDEVVDGLLELGALDAVYTALVKHAHTSHGYHLVQQTLEILNALAVTYDAANEAMQVGYSGIFRALLAPDDGSATSLIIQVPPTPEGQPSLREQALHVMSQLPFLVSAMRVGNREEHVVLEHLLASLQQHAHDLTWQLLLLRILEALTVNSENCKAVVNADCVTVLFYLMRVHQEVVDIQCMGMRVLRNLAQAGDEPRRRIRGDQFSDVCDNAFKAHRENAELVQLIEETRRAVAGH